MIDLIFFRVRIPLQTFFPYNDFRSVSLLDSKRLHNQFNEFLIIRRVLRGEERAWKNHPAVVMWRGYEVALSFYGLMIYEGMRDRGLVIPAKVYLDQILSDLRGTLRIPEWVGNENFHRAHRENLVRKDSRYYGGYFSEGSGDIYVWPIEVNGGWIYRRKRVGVKNYEREILC